MKTMLEKMKNKKCILACSGGPDSMALLDMARRSGVLCVVCHVNYNMRASALRDQKIVSDYCHKYDLPFFFESVYFDGKGNFQNWARQVRYEFFKQIFHKQECDAILTAHHHDDVLETFLMQKERKSSPSTFGIAEKETILDCCIMRPLLNTTKQELLDYCAEHEIAYGLDESNQSDSYTRNRIRKKLACMTLEQHKDLLEEMYQRNGLKKEWDQKINAILTEKMTIETLFSFEQPELLLFNWIRQYGHLQLSHKVCCDLLKQINTSKNVEISLSNYVKLSKMYNWLALYQKLDVSYCYVLDTIELLSTPYFSIRKKGSSTEAVTLSEDDFPLTIRNAQKEDAIVLQFGTKKIFRWFIDRKIPWEQRRSWPVVVNRHGDVILVPQIGCDCKHYSNNPTCFVVK